MFWHISQILIMYIQLGSSILLVPMSYILDILFWGTDLILIDKNRTQRHREMKLDRKNPYKATIL